MIKKVTIIILSIMLMAEAYSQCTPDTLYTTPGIYPDSATGFLPAIATRQYNMVITAVIPADTIIFPLPLLAIDSIGLVEVIGLPDGFQAFPDRPSGYWLGGTSGCLLITGTPTSAQIGVHPLLFKARGFLGGIGIPYDYEIDYYSIVVLDSTAFGIADLRHQQTISLKALPNPFSNFLDISFSTKEAGLFEISIFDAANKLILSEVIHANDGENLHRFNAGHLPSGVYFAMIRHRGKADFGIVKLLKY
jgi:hypothetical protein